MLTQMLHQMPGGVFQATGPRQFMRAMEQGIGRYGPGYRHVDILCITQQTAQTWSLIVDKGSMASAEAGREFQ